LSFDNDGGISDEDFIMDGVVYTGASSSVFGTSSSYFTNLYPGLFVLSAQNLDINEFEINGDLGADGGGDMDNYFFEYNGYGVFVKKVYNTKDPSVNHIIIVNG